MAKEPRISKETLEMLIEHLIKMHNEVNQEDKPFFKEQIKKYTLKYKEWYEENKTYHDL